MFFLLAWAFLPVKRCCGHSIWHLWEYWNALKVYSFDDLKSEPFDCNCLPLREYWSVAFSGQHWDKCYAVNSFFLLQTVFLLAFMVDALFDDSHALIQILGKGNCQTLFHFVCFNYNNNEKISNRVLNELFLVTGRPLPLLGCVWIQRRFEVTGKPGF